MKKKVAKFFQIIICLLSLAIFPFSFNNYINVSAFMDFVVFIDPGHGGKDNGTSYLDVYEDEINLQIANKLYEICLNKNLMAYISRVGDYDLASNYSTNRKRDDLNKRANQIEHSGCNIFVSIHVNQYHSSNVNGAMVYYEKIDENSYLLAKYIQSQLNILTKKDKKVHFDNFYLFKKCQQPGVLIECGFISNEEERIKLLDNSYQLSLAQAIYSGIYEYYINN